MIIYNFKLIGAIVFVTLIISMFIAPFVKLKCTKIPEQVFAYHRVGSMAILFVITLALIFLPPRIVPPEKVEPYLEVHGNEITVKDLPLYYSYPDTDDVYVKGERTLTYRNGTLSDEFSKYKLTDKEDKFYRQIIQESNN